MGPLKVSSGQVVTIPPAAAGTPLTISVQGVKTGGSVAPSYAGGVSSISSVFDNPVQAILSGTPGTLTILWTLPNGQPGWAQVVLQGAPAPLGPVHVPVLHPVPFQPGPYQPHVNTPTPTWPTPAPTLPASTTAPTPAPSSAGSSVGTVALAVFGVGAAALLAMGLIRYARARQAAAVPAARR